MKGTEKIIAHIQADAKAKADAILAQAEQQCAAIRADYEDRAQQTYAEKIRAGVKACEEAAESRERIAGMESKKDVLALKQEMVSASFSKALEKIRNMPDQEYLDFLVNLAVRSAPDGEGEVILNAGDRAAFGEKLISKANAELGGKLKLSDQTGDFSGGLKVVNGAVEVNNSLEILVDLCRGEMAAQLAKVLFE